MNIRKKDKLS